MYGVSIMDNRHTEIIVQEIKYWKEHNLLSKDKCNFLLALYTQGEQSQTERTDPLKQKSFQNIASLATLLCVVPLSFVITYLTGFYEILQIAIFLLFISFSFWTYNNFKKTRFPFQYFALLTGLIMTLYTTVFVIRMYTESMLVIKCVLFVNFSYWIWIGWKTQIKYVFVTGSIALLFLLSSIIL